MCPFSDRKPNPRVSQFEKAVTMEICSVCGTLHEFGGRCPVCDLTFEDVEKLYTKFKRE